MSEKKQTEEQEKKKPAANTFHKIMHRHDKGLGGPMGSGMDVSNYEASRVKQDQKDAEDENVSGV